MTIKMHLRWLGVLLSVSRRRPINPILRPSVASPRNTNVLIRTTKAKNPRRNAMRNEGRFRSSTWLRNRRPVVAIPRPSDKAAQAHRQRELARGVEVLRSRPVLKQHRPQRPCLMTFHRHTRPNHIRALQSLRAASTVPSPGAWTLQAEATGEAHDPYPIPSAPLVPPRSVTQQRAAQARAGR